MAAHVFLMIWNPATIFQTAKYDVVTHQSFGKYSGSKKTQPIKRYDHLGWRLQHL